MKILEFLMLAQTPQNGLSTIFYLVKLPAQEPLLFLLPGYSSSKGPCGPFLLVSRLKCYVRRAFPSPLSTHLPPTAATITLLHCLQLLLYLKLSF